MSSAAVCGVTHRFAVASMSGVAGARDCVDPGQVVGQNCRQQSGEETGGRVQRSFPWCKDY